MEATDFRQTILIVDDTPENIDVLNTLLKASYRIKAATSGNQALRLAKSRPMPDLILLDIMMPDLDGYEVCRRLKADTATRKIPVIFITTQGTIEDEYKGFERGCVDYITKPVSPPIVKSRVATQLALFDQNRALANKVAQRTRAIDLTRDIMILGLATLAESRDNEAGGHIMRTKNYIRLLGQYMSSRPGSTIRLDRETIVLLEKSAPLHDIGKVGVRDSILEKPGKLTPEEYNEMKMHTICGYEALSRPLKILGLDIEDSFLNFAREITLSHHEKWNGTGYPQGLKGEEIPFSARLMAVADVYDALISKRVYKPPFPHAKAVSIIEQEAGAHFDPEITGGFLAIEKEFREIALHYADHEEERRTLKSSC
ncbi:MAG: response regulator [Desulfobacteraceae bacterium]|nr:response regulator [Desulfobacteraceae bacterium]